MNRIKELRLQHGLTLKQLRNQLSKNNFSVSPDALAKYERGDRNPKVEIWQKLADYFGVSVPYLQGRYDHLTKKEALQVIHEVMTVCGISKEELKERL
ncbi:MULTISPECIES: helix-turn-helix domain-containing protein [Lactobacillus]|uniref:helix-turn-helix domain-containing protein n=1 Tax=Lactobacillus TaxID=1578 RepID=UPI000B5DAC74|nr:MULTISPECIES: helix-turn-helix transcriptional regulator [Lactobacillus]OXC41443.1 hypothetical protein AYP92_10110 [Lactobacillus crispatus]PEG90788.1 XRE family transcriptional regulator [Lactobacillus sp. UMNPBX12]PEG92668.1 XRE family transcriptional regulator [Lactobacillus sp. UMNPBX11]